MLLGARAKRVENDAGLHARDALLDVELENPVHVLREVEHDRDVAALAGEARARAAREDRRVERSARRHGRTHIVVVPRNDDADRHLAVVRGIGRVQRAAAAVEADFAAHGPPKLAVELGGPPERVDRVSRES